jgi:hypothetical protein
MLADDFKPKNETERRRRNAFRNKSNGYLVENGVLYKLRNGARRRVCETQEQVIEALRASHEATSSSNHHGLVRTQMRVSQSYYWYTITRDVKQFVRHCPHCSSNARNRSKDLDSGSHEMMRELKDDQHYKHSGAEHDVVSGSPEEDELAKLSEVELREKLRQVLGSKPKSARKRGAPDSPQTVAKKMALAQPPLHSQGLQAAGLSVVALPPMLKSIPGISAQGSLMP